MKDALTRHYRVEELARSGDEIYDRDIFPKLRPEEQAKARREEVEDLSAMKGIDLADPVVMSGAWRP